jgi:hypothetical protein
MFKYLTIFALRNGMDKCSVGIQHLKGPLGQLKKWPVIEGL